MSKTNKPPAQVDKPAFVFIEESGSSSAQSSTVKRKAIRSQAKRYAVAQKSKQPRQIRFVNAKVSNSHVDEESRKNAEFSQAKTIAKAWEVILLPNLPTKGYEEVRIEFGFDISFLSALASGMS